jgi:hypothetical protein
VNAHVEAYVPAPDSTVSFVRLLDHERTSVSNLIVEGLGPVDPSLAISLGF